MIQSLQTCVRAMTFLIHSRRFLQLLSSACRPLTGAWEETPTALSRLFVSHRGLLWDLGSLHGPKGQRRIKHRQNVWRQGRQPPQLPPGWPVGGLRGRRGRRDRSGVGWVWGGDWGNYTQADSICFPSAHKHPPPIGALLFSSCSFPV